ncbi:hypothetical protein AKJ16_DCAP23972 [Drosera capensis]
MFDLNSSTYRKAGVRTTTAFHILKRANSYYNFATGYPQPLPPTKIEAWKKKKKKHGRRGTINIDWESRALISKIGAREKESGVLCN